MLRNVLVQLLGQFSSVTLRANPGREPLPLAPSPNRPRELELKPLADYRGIPLGNQRRGAHTFAIRRMTLPALALLAGITLSFVA